MFDFTLNHRLKCNSRAATTRSQPCTYTNIDPGCRRRRLHAAFDFHCAIVLFVPLDPPPPPTALHFPLRKQLIPPGGRRVKRLYMFRRRLRFLSHRSRRAAASSETNPFYCRVRSASIQGKTEGVSRCGRTLHSGPFLLQIRLCEGSLCVYVCVFQ